MHLFFLKTFFLLFKGTMCKILEICHHLGISVETSGVVRRKHGFNNMATSVKGPTDYVGIKVSL